MNIIEEKLSTAKILGSTNADKLTYLFVIGSVGLFFISLISPLLQDSGLINLSVIQAEAFLQGRLDIPKIINDTAVYNNKNYVPFPPFPSVLVMPVLGLFGSVNPTFVSIILTVISVFTFWSILKKLDVDSKSAVWLILAFFLGTSYWFVVKGSMGVWHFAHVVAVAFILFSIRETLGNGRGYLAGLFLGCAFLSRQLSLYTSIFIIVGLITNVNYQTKACKIKNIVSFLFVFGIFVLIYLYFNAVRFGNPMDTGYSYIMVQNELVPRLNNYGLFNLAYVPFNFIYMFLQGPHFIFGDSIMPKEMDVFGTSLTFASPFVFAAFWAKGNKLLIGSAWLAIGLALIHMLLYYNNGWVQINGQRFTLDFLPILIVLVALSINHINKKALYAGVAYSVVLNTISFYLVPLLKNIELFF